MGVEWIRSSYAGSWRLFAGRPDVLTGGRYVVVPPGTPAYPGFHQVWSRYWVTGEDDLDGRQLGPAAGALPWFTGSTPNPYPNTSPAGTAAQIAGGAPFPDGAAAGLLYGFPFGCWAAVPQPALLWPEAPWGGDRQIWLNLATAIGFAYSDPAAGRAYIIDLMGGTAATVGDPSEFMPQTNYASNGSWQLMWSAGSTSDQLVLQALYGFLGPVEVGGLGVLLLHWQAAQKCLQRMQALGYDPAKPLILAGHSYGGVVAMIVAARIRQEHPAAPIQVVTYGMPRPGNQQTAAFMATVPGWHLVNRGDPVPDLPPNADILSVFPIPIAPIVADRWSSWYPVPSGRVIVETDGSFTYSQEQATVYLDYAKLIFEALFSLPLEMPATHGIETYINRLTPP